MKTQPFRTWLILVSLAVLLPACSSQPGTQHNYPETRRDDVKEVLHGTEILDPYRWLEDQESPATRAWIDAQNKYTNSVIGGLPGRVEIRQRLTALMKVDSIATPTERKGRYFYSKRKADQDLPVIYMRKGLAGAEEVLIDPHPMSSNHTVSVTLMDIDQKGGTLIYGIRKGGEDELVVKFMDVDAKKDLPIELPRARYFGVVLDSSKNTVYYSKHTPQGPRMFRHTAGKDSSTDQQIFGDGYGPDKIIGLSGSEDGRYLLIEVLYGSSADQTEVYVQNIQAGGPIVPIVKDIPARFYPQLAGDQLFLHTNLEAPNNRVFAVDVRNAARERWREVVPESSAVMEDFALVGGRIVGLYLEDVRASARVFTAGGKRLEDLPLPGIGSVPAVRGRWTSPEVFFQFTSFNMPTTVYRLDIGKRDLQVFDRLAVPFKGDEVEVQQVWFDSKDKTRVPMFLVHKKDLQLSGSNPVLLTGYGGFNLSQLPGFSARTAYWVERGGVYALPNLRGGSEFGEAWHKAGMLDKKQNVFDDFIAAAEWLIANKYTQPSKLAISGGSNGGLLVGAMLTQRPELFGAVVCSYPLLDMIRYHQFLVARYWVPEYGSSEDPAQFRYIYAYSPYHNVKPNTVYPPVLMISGDADTRVAPLHARKMAALLQAIQGNPNPALLKYDTDAGHSGGQPLPKQIDNLTDELSFLLWQLGASPSS